MILALLAYLAVVVLFAREQARKDARAISERMAIGEGDLEHKPRFRYRAIVALCMAFVTCVVANLYRVHITAWTLPCLLCAGAFLFSVVFRYRLNTLRGMDWRYVSPSNAYDRLFLGIANRVVFGWWAKREELEQDGPLYRQGRPKFRHYVHLAGKLAYLSETLFAASAIAVLFIIN